MNKFRSIKKNFAFLKIEIHPENPRFSLENLERSEVILKQLEFTENAELYQRIDKLSSEILRVSPAKVDKKILLQ